MNHDEAKAQIAALFEGDEAAVTREPLREHLKACEPCRAWYDQTALAMRRMLGNANEMSPEELFLFEPPLPAAKVVPLFRPGPVIGLAIAATLATVVIWAGAGRGNDDFGARGGKDVVVQPGLRAVCMRGEQPSPACAEGDVVLFAVTPNGGTHVKLLDGDQLVGEGPVADAPDTPLKWTVPWRAGLKVQALFSKCATCAPTAVTLAP